MTNYNLPCDPSDITVDSSMVYIYGGSSVYISSRGYTRYILTPNGIIPHDGLTIPTKSQRIKTVRDATRIIKKLLKGKKYKKRKRFKDDSVVIFQIIE